MNDMFRPHSEPARSIYDAFQAAAARRDEIGYPDWLRHEREVVHQVVLEQALKHGLRPLSLEEVEAAEFYAMGAVNYGATWAARLVELMATPEPGAAAPERRQQHACG